MHAHARVPRLYQRDADTGPTHPPEGMRLKHFGKGNSIKIYEKHGQGPRVETTLTEP